MRKATLKASTALLARRVRHHLFADETEDATRQRRRADDAGQRASDRETPGRDSSSSSRVVGRARS
jgi:hypothetical protein